MRKLYEIAVKGIVIVCAMTGAAVLGYCAYTLVAGN